jgi:DNA-binding NarL/FixJ family response regulator
MNTCSIGVLLVDDFEPWRHFVTAMIREQPDLQLIGEACDGLEAIQQAQKLQPDLILLDIGLPKLHGIDAAPRIRQVAPNARILFLSEINTLDVVEAAFSEGQGYIQKVDVGSELLPAIEALIRGEKFLDPRFTRLKNQIGVTAAQ